MIYGLERSPTARLDASLDREAVYINMTPLSRSNSYADPEFTLRRQFGKQAFRQEILPPPPTPHTPIQAYQPVR